MPYYYGEYIKWSQNAGRFQDTLPHLSAQSPFWGHPEGHADDLQQTLRISGQTCGLRSAEKEIDEQRANGVDLSVEYCLEHAAQCKAVCDSVPGDGHLVCQWLHDRTSDEWGLNKKVVG